MQNASQAAAASTSRVTHTHTRIHHVHYHITTQQLTQQATHSTPNNASFPHPRLTFRDAVANRIVQGPWRKSIPSIWRSVPPVTAGEKQRSRERQREGEKERSKEAERQRSREDKLMFSVEDFSTYCQYALGENGTTA